MLTSEEGRVYVFLFVLVKHDSIKIIASNLQNASILLLEIQ
jgi:hypothetical protein